MATNPGTKAEGVPNNIDELVRRGKGFAHRRRFALAKEPKNRDKKSQTDQEENNPSLVMQIAVEKVGIHIVCKQGERHDSDPILNQHHGKSSKDKGELLPERPEREMSKQEGQDQQGHA